MSVDFFWETGKLGKTGTTGHKKLFKRSAHSAVPRYMLKGLASWMISKIIEKLFLFGFPNHQKPRFGGALGLSLGSLGASWAVLVRLGVALGVHWVRLGTSEGVLEASWGYLGASWGDLGRVSGVLGSLLGIFLDDFRQF